MVRRHINKKKTVPCHIHQKRGKKVRCHRRKKMVRRRIEQKNKN
jgi:hypothetical protein